MHCDYLSSGNSEVFLLNCDISATRILYGLGYFDAMLPGSIELYTPTGQVHRVKVPSQILRSQTLTMLSSPNDDLQILIEV